MNFLEKKLEEFQKKSERTRQITLWVGVLVIMLLIGTVWVISINRNVIKSTEEFNKKAEEETQINELVGDKINEFEKLLEEGAVEENQEVPEESTDQPTEETTTEEPKVEESVSPELSPQQEEEINKMIEEIKEEDNL